LKITILNGNPDQQNFNFDRFVSQLSEVLETSEHQVETFVIRNMNIGYCQGCMNCWIKTPGECCLKDDSQLIRYSYINADLVLLASPVYMGFTSAILKKSVERLIPLLLPFFEFFNKEVHHVSRYEKYPRIGVLLEKSNDTDEEDMEGIKAIYTRNAINFKSSLAFALTTMCSFKEIVNEINSL